MPLDNKRKKLLEIFTRLASFSGDYRAMAYERAIVDVVAGRPLDEVGGDAIRANVRRWLETGRYPGLREAEMRERLMRVLGVGEKTATRWIELGITTPRTARAAARRGEIKLTRIQQLGLDHHKDLSKRIPRVEATQIVRRIRARIHRAHPRMPREDFVVAGSYRRGFDTIGDIDVIVIADWLRDVDFLDVDGAVSVVDGSMRKTFLWPGTNGVMRQIDILGVRREHWAASLLYFTGDSLFNQTMRGYAKSNGMLLNQYGLYRAGRSIPVKTERDIFDHLELRWVPPKRRNGPVVEKK